MNQKMAYLLIISVFGVAVLGFYAMNMGEHSHHAGCIASVVNGIDCPVPSNTPEFLSFHLGAFKSFSTAVLITGLSVLFALTLTYFAVLGFSTLFYDFLDSKIQLTLRFKRFLDSLFYFSLRKKIRWLILHENSPQFVSAPV